MVEKNGTETGADSSVSNSVFPYNYHFITATYSHVIRDGTIYPFETQHQGTQLHPSSTNTVSIKYYPLVYTILRTCSFCLGGEYNKFLRTKHLRKLVDVRRMKRREVHDIIYCHQYPG
jgi:hypothetical protein